MRIYLTLATCSTTKNIFSVSRLLIAITLLGNMQINMVYAANTAFNIYQP